MRVRSAALVAWFQLDVRLFRAEFACGPDYLSGPARPPCSATRGPFPIRSASFPPASIGGRRCARHAAAGSGRRPPPPARPRERLVQRERRTRILTPTFGVITTDAEKARAGARKGARDGGRGRPWSSFRGRLSEEVTWEPETSQAGWVAGTSVVVGMWAEKLRIFEKQGNGQCG